jgi:hypothetical protein
VCQAPSQDHDGVVRRLARGGRPSLDLEPRRRRVPQKNEPFPALHALRRLRDFDARISPPNGLLRGISRDRASYESHPIGLVRVRPPASHWLACWRSSVCICDRCHTDKGHFVLVRLLRCGAGPRPKEGHTPEPPSWLSKAARKLPPPQPRGPHRWGQRGWRECSL